MLKETVLDAVEAIKAAAGNLLIEATQTRRSYAAHVPGQAPSHTDVTTNLLVVMTRFKVNEIDGDRIRAGDYKAVLLPPVGSSSVTTEVNDVIGVPLLNRTFRAMAVEQIMVGDVCGMAIAQLRV